MSIILEKFSNNEVPTGTIDGANKDFDLAHLPDPEKSLEVFINGKFQVLDDDYTIDGLVITFDTAPWATSILKVNYRYIDAERLYITIAKIVGAGLLAAKDKADFSDDVNGAEKPDDNATKNEGALADLDTADFATKVSGAQKPDNNATKNEGALADLDTADFATKVSGAQKPDNNATKNEGALADEDTVNSALIDNLAVTAAKLATSSVETAKLNNLAVTGAKIAATTITSGKIAALAITAGKIAANAVTATEINVATLSAISANIGTVTAGTITGATIQTHAAASTGIKLDSNGMKVYGQTLVFWSGGDSYPLYVWGAGLRVEADFYADGTVRAYSFRTNQTPSASGSLIASHYITINCNGTLYRMMLDEN